MSDDAKNVPEAQQANAVRLDDLLDEQFGAFFHSVERQTVFIALLEEHGCPKWAARPGVKLLAPLLADTASRTTKWVGASARRRICSAFLKLPGAEKLLDAFEAVRAKLDLKMGAERSLGELIKDVSPEADALKHHLGKDLQAHFATLAAMKGLKESIDDVLMILEASSNPQPALKLWVAPVRDETRFVYRSRAIPFVGRGDEVDQLQAFLADERDFVWHLLLGQGGTGKSRLALEFLISHSAAFSSAAGFMTADALSTFDWETWQPTTPTLIVVDYASREAEHVARVMRALSTRTDLDCAVRLLLIERAITGTWYDTICARGQAEGFMVDECWSGLDGSLEPPEDVWPIIRFMAGAYGASPPKRKASVELLAQIDPHMRPLYAAFLGDALARGVNPRGWNREALVRNVLDHEQKNYWAQAGITKRHNLIFANATAVGGMPIEWAKQMTPDGVNDPDAWVATHLEPDNLNLVFDTIIYDDIPPLEPDILGEVFVMEAWRDFSKGERDRFVNFIASFGAWTGDFFARMASDFPQSSPKDLMWKVLVSDFEQDERAQLVLAYNLALDLAGSDYGFAKKIYFEFTDRYSSEKHDLYVADILCDMAFNLMSAAKHQSEADPLEIYDHIRGFMGESDEPQIRRSLCECAVNVIGPKLRSARETAKRLLDDVIGLSEIAKDDLKFAIERVSARANYICLLEGDDYEEAARLYVDLKDQAERHQDDEDVIEAWSLAAYHFYLLTMQHKGADDAEAFRHALSKENETVWKSVREQFEQDVSELEVRS